MSNAGRPAKYDTPESMQRVVDLYFQKCRANYLSDNNKPDTFTPELTDGEQAVWDDMHDIFPTVSGLSYMLGMSRQALTDYEKKDEFLDTVKRAKQRIEAFLEQRLYLNNPTGTIFNLKNNFKWKDKTEQDVAHSGNLTIDKILSEIDGKSADLPED